MEQDISGLVYVVNALGVTLRDSERRVQALEMEKAFLQRRVDELTATQDQPVAASSADCPSLGHCKERDMPGCTYCGTDQRPEEIH